MQARVQSWCHCWCCELPTCIPLSTAPRPHLQLSQVLCDAKLSGVVCKEADGALALHAIAAQLRAVPAGHMQGATGQHMHVGWHLMFHPPEEYSSCAHGVARRTLMGCEHLWQEQPPPHTRT